MKSRQKQLLINLAKKGYEYSNEMQKLEKEMKEFKTYKLRFSEIKRNADRALKIEMEELKQNNPHVNFKYDDGSGTLMKKILKHAMNNSILSLSVAYNDYMKTSFSSNINKTNNIKCNKCNKFKQYQLLDKHFKTNKKLRKEIMMVARKYL